MAMQDIDSIKLREYYEIRAPEYEKVYGFTEPARRVELDAIESLARRTFKGKSVLEIACGSGYWTELLSEVAGSILAVDSSEAMLEIARARNYTHANTSFKEFDAYNLGALAETYDSALAGFWLSHIPKKRLSAFLSGLQARLKTGAPVLLLDNNLVAGLGGEVVRRHDSSDTFKERTIADGSTHIVIKNYFTTEELQSLLAPFANEVNITMGKWYWSALYSSK
jgi:2-polyprenyl-3-methyl-5-hydroxy-6-metoxy-1,4-benzoquinol methylase